MSGPNRSGEKERNVKGSEEMEMRERDVSKKLERGEEKREGKAGSEMNPISFFSQPGGLGFSLAEHPELNLIVLRNCLPFTRQMAWVCLLVQ